MTRTLAPEPGQAPSPASGPRRHPSTRQGLLGGMLRVLDALLAEELRHGTASELARYRTPEYVR